MPICTGIDYYMAKGEIAMKNFSFKKAAVAAAAVIMMASSFPAMAVSASSSNTYSSSYRYYSVVTGKYYNDYNEAVRASNNNAYNVYDGYYVDRGYGRTVYSTDYRYYSIYTGLYYRNYNEALSDSRGDSDYVKVVSGTYADPGYRYYYNGYPYYSSVTGKYYATLQDAVEASKGDKTRVVTYNGYNGTVVTNNGKGIYYSSYTGKYYDTIAEALSASLFDMNYITVNGGVPSSYYYTYTYNGRTYTTLSEAEAAGGTWGVNITRNTVRYDGSYYYDGYYYNGYYGYYGSYGYYGPYAYYPNFSANSVKTSTKTTTTSSSKKVSAGVAYLYGYESINGWTAIRNYVSNQKKNKTVSIDMNGSTVVSSDVLKAAKAGKVNLQFLLDNGILWDVKASKITSTSEVDISVTPGVNVIPASLVKTATKDAKSYGEFAVSNQLTALGFTGEINAKFAKERASSFVKVYKYDPNANTLVLVDKTMVENNGNIAFDVKEGGYYLVVII